MTQQILPREAYTDPGWFDGERKTIFRAGFHFAGFVRDLQEAGDYVAVTICGYPMIVLRDQDGALRAFHNLCRHRGTELADADCDISGTIRCPYHRWGYATDGSLIATPFFDEVPRDDFDRADFGLMPVRVATWGPLLFDCLSDETCGNGILDAGLCSRCSGH